LEEVENDSARFRQELEARGPRSCYRNLRVPEFQWGLRKARPERFKGRW